MMDVPIKAVFKQDPDTGKWTVTVPEVPGVVTQGKTLEDAFNRVRNALSLVRDDAADLTIFGVSDWGHYPGLTPEELAAVQVQADLRLQFLVAKSQLESQTQRAVTELILRRHRTFQSAGELLGITRQRVQQIAKRIKTVDAAMVENDH